MTRAFPTTTSTVIGIETMIVDCVWLASIIGVYEKQLADALNQKRFSCLLVALLVPLDLP